MRWRLPTLAGSTCSKLAAVFSTALTCRPALWAKAEAPTNGAFAFGIWLATSATKWLSSVRPSSAASDRQSIPILSLRFAATETRLALPTRSP